MKDIGIFILAVLIYWVIAMMGQEFLLAGNPPFQMITVVMSLSSAASMVPWGYRIKSSIRSMTQQGLFVLFCVLVVGYSLLPVYYGYPIGTGLACVQAVTFASAIGFGIGWGLSRAFAGSRGEES